MDLIRNSFEAGELAPGMNGRTAARQYPHGCRTLENCVVMLGSGGAERRPGLEIIRETIVTPAVPEVPEVPATYTYTWFSENGAIWGVPLGDRTILCINAGGAARNAGGGTVGIPFANNPFVVGDVIRIRGTSSYDGQYALLAGTSATELVITKPYTAETFDGTETVVRYVATDASSGRMLMDSSGNLWIGHNWSVGNATAVTEIEPDGTMVYDRLTWGTAPVGTSWSQHTVVGLALTADEASLYVLTRIVVTYLFKFDVATGARLWYTATDLSAYDIAADDDGNVYAYDTTTKNLMRHDATTGVGTELEDMGEPAVKAIQAAMYAVAVDSDLELVITAGWQYALTSEGPETLALMYNLAVRTVDGSAQDTLCVGTNYVNGLATCTRQIPVGFLAVKGNYIYVLLATSGTTTEIHKIRWEGSTLTDENSVAGPAYGTGLYFDLWGNLVVVNQDWTNHQSNVFYYYDEGLTLLGYTGGLYSSMLLTWDQGVGGIWVQGCAIPNGDLGTPAIPGIPAVTTTLPVEL